MSRSVLGVTNMCSNVHLHSQPQATQDTFESMSLKMFEIPETARLQILVAASECAANFLDPHLFKSSNRVLRTEEAALVHDQIRAVDEDIGTTDEILALALSTLEKYTAKRAHQTQCRRVYSALLSPLRTLPAEILGEIFAYSQLHSISTRWNVSHVCQRWRQVALATPELWTSIAIPPTAATRIFSNWGEISRYETTCLERAKSWPTKWYFRQPQIGEYDERQAKLARLEETFSRMVGSAACSEVTFETIEDEPGPVFFRKVLTELTKSSSATLRGLYIATSRVPSDILLQLGSFSQLSELSISHLPYSDDTQVATPWLRLTKLSITAARLHESVMTQILKNTPNLENLSIKIAALDLLPNQDELYRAGITLCKLKTLTVDSTNKPFYEYVDRNMETPELCDLRIYADKTPLILSKLHCFTTGCRRSLRRFWISGVTHYELRAMSILGFEKLEELVIHMDEDIRVLNDLVAVGNWDLFPCLTTLRVICAAGNDFRNRFLEVVESRGWDGTSGCGRKVVPLQHAHLHAYLHQATKNVWAPDDANIREIRNRGLDLIVQTPIAGADRPAFLT